MLNSLLEYLAQPDCDLQKVVAYDDDQSINWSWAELLAQAEQIKKQLNQMTTGAAVVISVTTHSPSVLIHLLAAWLGGKTFMPLNASCTEEEFQKIYKTLKGFKKPIFILVEDRIVQMPQWLGTFAPVIITNLQKNAEAFKVDLADANLIQTENPAVVLLTSGTTAEPRLVGFSHLTLSAAAFEESENETWSIKTVMANLRPHFTSAGLNTVWPLFIKQYQLVFSEKIRRTPIQRFLFEFIAKTQLDYLILSPTYISEFLKNNLDENLVLSKNLKLYFGGQALPSYMIDQLQKMNISVSMRYGMTEFARIISKVDYSKHKGFAASYIGPLAKGIAARIDQNVLELKANGLFDFEFFADQIKFLPADRWYKTFDQIEKQSSEGLYLVGRSPDFIEVRGFRFHRSEIENHVRLYPNVHQALLMKCAGQLVLFILLQSEDQQKPDLESIKKSISDRFSDFKWPQKYLFLNQWPAAVNGKIDLAALEKMAAIES